MLFIVYLLFFNIFSCLFWGENNMIVIWGIVDFIFFWVLFIPFFIGLLIEAIGYCIEDSGIFLIKHGGFSFMFLSSYIDHLAGIIVLLGRWIQDVCLYLRKGKYRDS